MVIGGILFDGIDSAGFNKLSGFQCDRARSGANIPHDRAGLQIELGECDGSHFRLRDEPGFRPALGEYVIRIAETHQPLGSAWGIRPAGLSLQDHDVQRIERHVLYFGKLALGDALVLAAQVLADVGAEIIEAANEQFPGDSGGVAMSRW